MNPSFPRGHFADVYYMGRCIKEGVYIFLDHENAEDLFFLCNTKSTQVMRIKTNVNTWMLS